MVGYQTKLLYTNLKNVYKISGCCDVLVDGSLYAMKLECE